MQSKLITILGPTAVGKTKFAVQLANKFNGEIISADSRQVYKYMNIGTGKDLEEYVAGDQEIKHHLIDVAEPTEEFDLFKFKRMFKESFNKIVQRDKQPFLVGGTGLYIHSVIKDYQLPKVEFDSKRYGELSQLDDTELKKILLKLNPKLHNTTDLLQKERIIKAIMVAEKSNENFESPKVEFDSFVIGINLPRSEVKQRITARLKKRLQSGMIEEVKKLIEMGVSIDKLLFFGLEYKFIALHLRGELNYNDMFQKLNSAIHTFAKKQMTWFRKMEKEGIEINWLEPKEIEKAAELITRFLGRN